MDADQICRLALECGFDLAGIAEAGELPEAAFYLDWVARGLAGKMEYLTDHRAGKRRDVRNLLPSARSVLVVGQLYNSPMPYSTALQESAAAWISRYAWGDDYHDVMRGRLQEVERTLRERTGCETRICIDTAPVLERPLARAAGLGWIGKNSCLINQEKGSWFFLGELLLSLELTSHPAPPPDRCGSCTRCIDACPTAAIVPTGRRAPEWEIDARLCIAYLNIELRGPVPEGLRSRMGNNLFGCDICQDVCPWNRRAAVTEDSHWRPRHPEPDLETMAALSDGEFRELFRSSPVSRSRYSGFLRNVAIGMGNSGNRKYRRALQRLASSEDENVSEHARWGLRQLG